MKRELKSLKITESEIERLTGLEVSELFIGGILGTYRPSLFQHPKRVLLWGFTQLVVFILLVILALPLGLLVIRQSSQAVSDLPTMIQFLQITLGTAIVILVAWNYLLWRRLTSLKTLACLADEVDHYNEVINSVVLLNEIEEVTKLPGQSVNWPQLMEVLQVIRETLVCGLMIAKILRENRSLLARQHELFVTIEHNLILLSRLDTSYQVGEDVELLKTALQIGTDVYQEVQKLSPLQSSSMRRKL